MCRSHTRTLAAGLVGAWLLCVSPVYGASPDYRLIDAVKNRDTTAIHTLLRMKGDVNAKRGDGSTALHWAVQWNDLPTAKLLLAAGANVNAQTDLGVTPIGLACLNGSVDLVGALLDAGADANAARKTGETALMTCSRSGNVKAVDLLLAHGADVAAAETAQGQTALMWAAARNHPEVVRALIAHGADVHARSSAAQFTPLLFAAREGASDVIEVLLASGADVNEPAKDGTTALLASAYTGHWDLAKWLLAKGADPNRDQTGYTVLHWAAGSWENDISGSLGPDGYEWIGGRGPGKLELVQALLAKGADPNARLQRRPPRYGYGSGSRLNFAGATPFILASLGGDVAIMKALLAAGADPHAATKDGTTALMTAAGFGRIHGESRTKDTESLEAVKFVLAAGVDVNAANKIGETALHAAAYFQVDSVVDYLIANGAKVNALNKRGETPLVIAEGYSGGDTGGNTFYSDKTAAVLRKAGGNRTMVFQSTVVKVETACPLPAFLIADPTLETSDRYGASEYGTSIRVKPEETMQFGNSGCAALVPGATVRITGTRLGHLLDKDGHPWDGSIDASQVEVLK